MRNYLAKQEMFFCMKLSCRAKKVLWWEIILQSKKGSLIRNYLAEQEKYKFYYLKSNSLIEIILQRKKRIAFMLLIIDKCLMAIELSLKGRNLNIAPQTRTPWKRGRIILVVVCKSTFLDWVVWFRNYVTIICVIYRGGLKINLENI
jgi:hypothetical protein